jgi:hypothetical protein
MTDEKPFADLEPAGQLPIGMAQGIAAIALNMAMKYYDITIVKDGTMYQQYKLEGRNMRDLHLDAVFETAIKIEKHLIESNGRIDKIIIEAVEAVIDEEGDMAENTEKQP